MKVKDHIFRDFYLNTLYSNKYATSLIVFLFFSLGWAQHLEIKAKVDSTEVSFQNYLLDALEKRINGHYGRAIETLDLCDKIHPNNATILFEYTKNQLLSKKYAEAISSFEKLLRQKPNNPIYLKELMGYFDKSKVSNMVVELMDKLVKEDRRFKISQLWTFYYLKDYDTTIRLLKDQQIHINNKTKDSLQTCCTINLETQRGEEKPTKILKTNPGNPIKDIKVTIQKLIEDNKVSAIKNYVAKYLYNYPTQPMLYYAYGWVLAKEQPNKAIEQFLSALDYLIEDKILEKSIYLELSKAYKRINNNQKSDFYLKKYKNL